MDPSNTGAGAPDGANGTTTPAGSSPPQAASGTTPDGAATSQSMPRSDKEWVKIAETARDANKRAAAAEERLAKVEAQLAGRTAQSSTPPSTEERLGHVEGELYELGVRRVLDEHATLSPAQKDLVVKFATKERPGDVRGFIAGILPAFGAPAATPPATTPAVEPVQTDLGGAPSRSPQAVPPRHFTSYTPAQWAALTKEQRDERIAAEKPTNPFVKPKK